MPRPDSSTLRAYFFGLELHGIKLGLRNIERLLAAWDNPQEACPCVHVAGTNGKGSVLAFLDAMVRAAGYRPGRFISPHLIAPEERFLADAVPIEPGALDEAIAEFQQIARGLDIVPTFFECCTAIAFHHFRQAQVELGLVETGMGGRLDSTNVVRPAACAITNIALEHTAFLGDTLEKIAFEKAGILKPGAPCIVTETQPGPLDVIRRRAREVGAPVWRPGREFSFSVAGTPAQPRLNYTGPAFIIEDAPLGLAGTHQAANAAAALALAELLQPRFPALNAEFARRGLAAACWPCRNEQVLTDPPVHMDVAHNAAGAARLAELYRDCVVLMAVSSDKDAGGMLNAIAPVAHALILTTFGGGRSLSLEALQGAAARHPHRAIASMADAIEEGLRLASPEHPLLITGSIFAAGEARRILIEQHGAPPLRFA